jgi:Cu2+-exporting ATPase
MGCEAAYTIIQSLSLQKYYKYCRDIYGSTPPKINIVENQLSYDEYVHDISPNLYRINLLVEGIHCGSCVWLIENTLRKDSKVKKAYLNLSTRRLIIEWIDDIGYVGNLVNTIFALGYKLVPFTPEAAYDETKDQEKELLKRMGVAGLVSIAMMMIVYGVWAGNFDGSMGYYTRMIIHILASIIAIPAIFYSGLPFLQSALKALKASRANMDLPIAIGILGATLISVQETMLGNPYTYYDAAIGLIFFLLIGRFLELKSRNKARDFAQKLILSQPRTITIDIGGKLTLLPLTKAKVGDIAFISVGDRIPADGIIIEGNTEVDNSLITGESIPINFKQGDAISAGTLNIGSPIKVKITALAGDTLLGEIIQLVEAAEQGRAGYVRVADKLSQYFTPIVLALSITTFILWHFIWGSTINESLLHSIALLVITCPCALGLAVPVVQVVATSRLMARGIILKTSDALEKLAAIDHIVFDKTGTLTQGQPKLDCRDQISDTEFEIISSLASFSRHPLCREITGGNVLFDSAVEELKGLGLTAYLNGYIVKLGSRKFCEINKAPKDSCLEMWYKRGATPPIRLTFTDKLRPDAQKLIKAIKCLGFTLEILSGDRSEVVHKIASEVGIPNFKAEANPKEKYEYLQSLENAGKKVLMVGDGLNDAAALKAAFVSISPSTSLAITQTNSDIVFQGEHLMPIIEAYKVSILANKLVKQNFVLALLYNGITIPLAIIGYINPIVAAIAMSTSSILVVLNSLRRR